MLIKIKVEQNSKKREVVKKASDHFLICVRERPEAGRANEEMLGLLSAFLGIPRKKLKIIKGSNTKNKWVKILGV